MFKYLTNKVLVVMC